MALSKCAMCDSKEKRFFKKQVGTRLWSKLGIRTSLSKIPLLGDTFFLEI